MSAIRFVKRNIPAAILAAIVPLGACGAARAQNSSLFSAEAISTGRRPLTIENGSFYYRPLPPPREARLHDLVTIRVEEKAKAKSSGDVQRSKTGAYDAVLKDWIKLMGLNALGPARQADGDPRVQGELKQNFQAQSELSTTETLQFEITTEVIDIRPNGNLVLEGRRSIRINDENWEYSLMGVCRQQDIQPNNTVLSKNVAELVIYKRERGSVSDGYRRGWVMRLFDTYSPF